MPFLLTIEQMTGRSYMGPFFPLQKWSLFILVGIGSNDSEIQCLQEKEREMMFNRAFSICPALKHQN